MYTCRIFNADMENIKQPVAAAQAQIDRSHYKTIVKTDKHTFVSDEPLTIGGTDSGPSPQELLLASLGSCTAITLRMYIDRKMWIVETITVNMELFEVDGATLIERKLSFEGEISSEQEKRLIQIADSCPIHKMLTGKIIIQTALA
jgi:putative redox protein